MPLPTWYRFIRTLPGVVGGLFFLGGGLYLALTPTTYAHPDNPKLVAYTNNVHPFVVGFGIAVALAGLALTYVGGRQYFRLPEGLREYTYEQLRLGQMLTREIVRLTIGEYHYWSVELEEGTKLSAAAYSYYSRNRTLRSRLREWLSYGFGERVSFTRAQPGTEVDGVLHVPEVSFSIDTFTGKASRHESVEQYEIREEPPVLEGEDAEFLKFAIRETGASEEWEEELESLTEPRFTTVRLNRDVEDPGGYYRFMRQMGLDKPSAEELQQALEQLKEW